ncbi:MAG: VanW family protein [Lachnospiraceae bacterium]|nr:VanW family protein [Lachnospiraceae bacterium]
MKRTFKLRVAALCMICIILSSADTALAASAGAANVINNTNDVISFDEPAPEETEPVKAVGGDAAVADETGSEAGPSSEITINVTAADDPVDITKDEVLENATSLTTEINVEVPASFHVDPNATIGKGIYADDIDLSGLTYKEAKEKIEEYIAVLRDKQITLESINDRTTSVSAGDLGIKWSNSDLLLEAIGLGKAGNVIARYKANKDLEVEHKVYDIDVSADKSYVKNVVQAESDASGSEAKDATMIRENGQFKVTEGQEGFGIDVDKSVDSVMDAMSDWDKNDISIELVSGMIQPKGKAEDLMKIHDLLGSFNTSFSSSGKERSGNVRNGTKLINGTVLYPGDQLSVYETVSPFTEENGYFLAGSYLNGMVVESLGGGICQVSSTLYNAVIRAELQVDERSNHSMIVSYVDMSADAAISGTAKDFKFTNNLENPIYIEGYTTDDKQVVFNIYGVETRPSNRTLAFESVELERTEPEGEKVVADSELPAGKVSVQSAHTGYRGEYWKIVKVDGVETERVRLNRSKYQAVPRTATVGTATDNAMVKQVLNNAIATGSIDACKAAAAQVAAGIVDPAMLVNTPPAEGGDTEVPAPPPTTDAPPQDQGGGEGGGEQPQQ